MNIYDIEHRTLAELQQGYYSDGGTVYICPLCDFAGEAKDVAAHLKAAHGKAGQGRRGEERERFACLHCDFKGTEAAQEAHQEQVHRPDKEALVTKLLNADSVIHASYNRKMVFYRIFLGMSDQGIATDLGMNVKTVRSHRFFLRGKIEESKVWLLLGSMMNLEKQSEGDSAADPKDLIPGQDDQGITTGFYTKEEVHNPEAPIRHNSVLVLVAQWRDGRLHYLICTKSSRMLTYAGKIEKKKKRWIDIVGTQCRAKDGTGTKVGVAFPRDGFLAAAKRALEREVYIKGNTPDASKLMYLYTDETGAIDPRGTELHPAGRNLETTAVYLYRLPKDIPQDSILTYDTWTDSLGGSETKRHPSEFATWEELEQFASSGDTALMDGLRRVVMRMQQDAGLKKKMFAMLSEAK